MVTDRGKREGYTEQAGYGMMRAETKAELTDRGDRLCRQTEEIDRRGRQRRQTV